jgi:hypothetical protein
MKKWIGIVAGLAVALSANGLTPQTAHASTIEKWVANFTDQCTKPSLCGDQGLGGEWGHGTFIKDDSTGAMTGEVEVSFAFHNAQGAGPIGNGVSHLKTHITQWSVGPGFNGIPNILFDDYYSTFTGGTGLFTDGIHGGPPFDSEHCFLGCPLYTEIPAVPGHFTLSSFFGIDEEPGFSYVATVVKIS